MTDRELFYQAVVSSLMLGVLIGIWISSCLSDEPKLRTEAVKRGLARWKADENGHTTFEWTCSVGPEPYECREIKP